VTTPDQQIANLQREVRELREGIKAIRQVLEAIADKATFADSFSQSDVRAAVRSLQRYG